MQISKHDFQMHLCSLFADLGENESVSSLFGNCKLI